MDVRNTKVRSGLPTGLLLWLMRASGSIALAFPIMLYVACTDGQQTGTSSAAEITMYKSNPQRTGSFPVEPLRSLRGVKWTAQTCGSKGSTPAVTGGYVYVGSKDGNLYKIDVETGEVCWRFPAQASIPCSPAVADGRVYFGLDGPSYFALNAATAELEWKVYGGYAGYSHPVVVDKSVYFGCWHYSIVSLALDDGSELWKYELDQGHPLAPTAIDGDIVFFGQEMVEHPFFRALNRHTGELIWSIPSGPVSTAPVVAGDAVIVTYGDSLLSLRHRDGTRNWARSAPGWGYGLPSPVYDAGLLYMVGRDSTLVCLQASDGHQLWSEKLPFSVFLPLSLARDVLYVAATDRLLALSCTDGNELWRYHAKDTIVTSPVPADSMVVFSCADGLLYALH